MLEERINQIQSNIRSVAPDRDVTLIGVTKTVPPERLQEAYTAGLRIFGENRIQEALPKIAVLASVNPEWHFIGHLQTNKAREAVRHFSMIQAVDSSKLLTEINKQAAKIGKKIDILLEVNLAGEQTKYGFTEQELTDALNASRNVDWIALRGLMMIPPFFEDAEQARPYFRRLRELLVEHRKEFPELQQLSMGMSHDYITAVEEGATMVRIGTAIFGERK